MNEQATAALTAAQRELADTLDQLRYVRDAQRTSWHNAMLEAQGAMSLALMLLSKERRV